MSAYRKQLSWARANTGIRNIAGKCSNTAEFADLINRVTERLMDRGNWWNQEQTVKLCVYGCDCVFPRWIGTVLGARTCCNGNSDIRNGWYEILGNTTCFDQWNSNLMISDNGTAPCFNEISGNTGKFIRYHVVAAQDVGKQITLFGRQYGAQPLQELDNSGNLVMGLSLTAATPFAQTSVLVTKITEVTREQTVGFAYLYEYDPATTLLRMLAIYEPSETTPQFRRSTVRGLCHLPGRTDANGVKSWQMEVLAKIEYIPAEQDRDFLLIDNANALIFGIQSVRYDEAGDPTNAEIYIRKAVEALNFELRNRTPGNQFVVKSNVMGSNRVISNLV